MWPYIQMWFPLLTIALTAAICVSVVSFIVGHAKSPHAENRDSGIFFEMAEQCFRRSRGDRKTAELDAIGNQFMAKTVELDTKQQKLARDT